MTASFNPLVKATAKSSTHSRFIPREEIDEVASWHFSSMDNALEPVQASEPGKSSESSLQAETSESESAALEAERHQAWSNGFAQGRQLGEEETRAAMAEPLQKALEANALRMGELLHGMTEQLLSSEQKIARQLLELACDIARQVVRQELTTNTQQLRTVIGEALEMIVDEGLPATVRMHPDDLALMKDGLVQTLGDHAPEFVADLTITPGGCLLQTPSMAVDATVEKRWARAVGNLGLSSDWNDTAHSTTSQPSKSENAEEDSDD